MQKQLLSFFVLFVWLQGGNREVHAELVFSSLLQADFEFEVVDGPFSAIEGINTGDILLFQAIGALDFVLDDSVPGATSMAFTNAAGTLTGVSPGPFMPFEITPDAEFVGGSLNNIVRDGGGQITSADVVDLQMLWEMFGTPAIFGGDEVLLYSSDPLGFNGHISSLPFSNGDQLSGPNEFEVYFDAGLGNPGLPGGDPLAAIGRSFTITAVPEPSFFALLALSAGIVTCRRRRK